MDGPTKPGTVYLAPHGEGIAAEPIDRSSRQNNGSMQTMTAADRLLDLVQEVDASLNLKYNKHYIGLTR